MKITLLTPGAGENFYCENCMRDAATLRALRAAGHDAMSAPLYLPTLDPETGRSREDQPVFFGGVNVYLQQKLPLFRHTPRWMDKIFDAGWLLRWAGKKTGMTDAKVLGEMTLSMLRGENGRQIKELRRLADFLSEDAPDVLVLSNLLLAGMARYLKQRTGATILCWMQDEDHFLDSLTEPYRELAWEELRKRSRDTDLLLSPSEYYSQVMTGRLKLESDRVAVLPQGIETPATPTPPASPASPASPTPTTASPAASEKTKTPVIGFLSQFNSGKGLDTLVESLAILSQKYGLDQVRMIADGGQTQADHTFVKALGKRIDLLSLTDRVELRRQFDRPSKSKFLSEISVLAVPSRCGEAYGLYILEALAAGVPVVMPNHGGQAELVRATGGGILFEPNSTANLADKLRQILTDRQLALKLAQNGQQNVKANYSAGNMAKKLAELAQKAMNSTAT